MSLFKYLKIGFVFLKKIISENRRYICFCCVDRDRKCLSLEKNSSLIQLVKEFVDPEFSLYMNSHQTGNYGSCKTNLYFKQRGKAISKAVETSWLNERQQVKELGRMN